jgi:UDP-glucose 4-epimerase
VAYWKEKRVPTVIARLFNTVGPRQTGRYGMVVPNLVVQALTGKDITVFGDGTQSRCFTHVNDTVDALVGIASHPDANGEVYNVGSDHEISIVELARRIKRMTDSDSKIVFVSYGRAYEEGFEDVRRRVPDITKLTGLIDYRPRLSLEETLESIIADQRARLREHGVAAIVR